MADTEHRKTWLQYSMEGGLWLGIYLILRFIFTVSGTQSSIANILAITMFVGTPVVLYRLIKGYDIHIAATYFSMQWMLGIMLSFFASLISCIPEYIFYTYIDPNYITTLFEQAYTIMNDMLHTQENLTNEEINNILSAGVVPTSIEMVLQTMWSNVFLGSITALCIATADSVMRKKRSINN